MDHGIMSRGQILIATTAALNLLATFFVAIRIVSRFFILKSSQIDDYLIIFGLLLSWGVTAVVVTEVQFGLGQHTAQLSAETYQNQILCLYVYLPLYNVTLSAVKLSALFQFLRFFVLPRQRQVAWTLITIVSLYAIAMFIASICFCLPIQSFWIAPLPGKCIDFATFWYFNSSFNVATDMAVVLLPLYVLKDLSLPRRQKWALWGVFLIGIFTCVTSIIRLSTVHIFLLDDSSYNNAPPTLWSSIEVNTAIVCACMPCLKPLIEKMRMKWLLHSHSSSADTTSSGDWKLDDVRPTANSDIEADATHHTRSTELL